MSPDGLSTDAEPVVGSSPRAGGSAAGDISSIASAPVPSFREKTAEIRQMLADNESLSLLYIDASRLSQIENDYGTEIYEEVVDALTRIILDMKGKQTRRTDLVTVNEKHGNTFLIFLSKKRDDAPFGQGDLEKMSDRINTFITQRLHRMTSTYLRGRPKLALGYSLVLRNPLIKDDRLILKLIDEARRMAQFQAFRMEVKNRESLQEIILRGDVRTVYQPIIDLYDHHTLGFEALSRGPRGTDYESPYMLFGIADESDLLFELDRLCRRNALVASAGLDRKFHLFLNLLPSTIRDPEFQGKRMLGFLERYGLSPSRIVLEITEQLAIENYSLFLDAIRVYTDMGFSIAVDDMGAGYSGLEKIVHLKPRFLKIDLMMVQQIDTSFVKREMLKAIQSLADNIGAYCIAEGIERRQELDTLRALGIRYGQGFLFARPARAPIPVNPNSVVSPLPAR